ncbi:hypothetical protein FACS1894200_13570 [Spirochaetia bacterium]|nr:hypothetical protein FACS1894200_13570 [Spirochaetia bacterium]
MYKIMIIEDHTMTRRGVASFLFETGRWLVVGEAGSLEEAQEFFKTRALTGDAAPDIVLLDLQLL